MKYFAKYLPVEGEIKKGDRFIDKEFSNKLIGISQTDLPTDGIKVKLFLCSRDVQVSDKFFDIQGKEFICNEIYPDFDMDNNPIVMIGDLHEATDSKNTYKIIGEISPDATWVKEGDEFDDSNIQIWAVDIQGNYITEKGNDSYQDDMYDNGIKIKGPCGHFH